MTTRAWMDIRTGETWQFERKNADACRRAFRTVVSKEDRDNWVEIEPTTWEKEEK